MRGLDWVVAVGVVWGIAGASTDVLQVSLSALIGFVGRLGKESPFSATATAAAASTLIGIQFDILATPIFFLSFFLSLAFPWSHLSEEYQLSFLPPDP